MEQLNTFLNQKYGYLTFFRVKVEDSVGIYCARIQTLLGKEERFVMIIVPFHMAFKERCNFNDLRAVWLSFQTRAFDSTYEIPKQPMMTSTDTLQKIQLSVQNRNMDETHYYSPFPVDIVIQHDKRKRSAYQYNDKITLTYALDTWKCIINKFIE